MMNILKFFLIFLCVIFVSAQFLFALEKGPFWRVKPNAFSKVTEERKILVSVKADQEKDLRSLKLMGGGLVRSSLDRAFQIAKEYERLPKVTDLIREVKHNAATHELYVHGVAFDYHARMRLIMTEVDRSATEKVIQWRIVSGAFTGMIGEITFESWKNQTLMGLNADYSAKKLPLPEFFIEFALEIVLEKVANRMRSYIENEAGKNGSKFSS